MQKNPALGAPSSDPTALSLSASTNASANASIGAVSGISSAAIDATTVGSTTVGSTTVGSAILAAALALPGIGPALAESAPDHGLIAFKYLDYQDWQPGLDRVSAHSPALTLLAPIAGVWSLEATLASDDVSGASPRFHTDISGASKMQDRRNAAELRVTRYFPRGTLALTAAFSNENDYLSRAVSAQGSVSSEDKNTTWLAGIGVANDRINPVNHIVKDERKHTVDILLGVTQVLTVQDIAQLNLTHARGSGYFSDPYKSLDKRPRDRNQTALLARWNHHFSDLNATSRISYRYYSDSFQVRAHTLGGEYVQTLPQGWTVTPSLRLYSQSAAFFYFDPVYDAQFGPPFPPGFQFGSNRSSSSDQRLSAFGAATLGIKVAKQIGKDLTLDLKLEKYAQRGSWRMFGDGSPDLAPFYARSIQFGAAYQW